jgi:uncharacterized protein (TIGR03437 family)
MNTGSYSGSITATSADGTTSAVIQVLLLVSAPLPSMDSTNVANAASSEPAKLAPGSLFSVSANSLAAQSQSALTIPWPTMLNGVSVTINGIPAPLGSIGPGEIVGQVPFEISSGPAILIVQSNGVPAQPISVGIAGTAPGIFLSDGTHAAALNQDSKANSPDNPALVGSILSVFWTGQGLVNNPISTGVAASAQWLNTTVAITTATIGGQPALVVYSGLAPRYVGLAQANIQVPDLPSGDYPLVLTVGSGVSNSAIVSVTEP